MGVAGDFVPGTQVVGSFEGAGSYYTSGFGMLAERQAGFVAFLDSWEEGYVAVYVG